MDSTLKRMNRLCETRLQQADMLLAIAKGHTGNWLSENIQMKDLWKLLLFNQFHDTLGGTAIKEARDEAIMQLSSVSANSGIIKAFAMQAIVNDIDTRGEGFPLFLFHTGGQEYHGYVTTELNWFCKHPLKLLDPSGNEVAYQRIHTKAKVRNYNLGGRRSIVFYADIPTCGYAMYRVLVEETGFCYNNDMELDNPDPYQLENEFIRVVFNKEQGLLQSLIEKSTGYNCLVGPVSYPIWIDQRDTWGHQQDNRPYCYSNEDMKLKSLEKVESGKIRECIRAIYEHGGSYLEQLYYLYADEKEVVVENHLHWDKQWQELQLQIPMEIQKPLTKAEGSYCIIQRHIADEDTYYMHRFLDVRNENNQGLAVANDSKYSFSIHNGALNLTLARSAIYAQGSGLNWYCPLESYEYADIGITDFTFVLHPHNEELPTPELYRMANKVNGAYEYLVDSCHAGNMIATKFSLASTNRAGVEIMSVKKAEDDQDYIIRLLEIEGKDQEYTLNILGKRFDLTIGHYEIQTLKVNAEEGSIIPVNLLEFNME
jgi:alpha-mannosidase